MGVEVDSGQIVGVDDFISNYNKSSLATPLGTSFYFRENEMQETLSTLETLFTRHHNFICKNCLVSYMKSSFLRIRLSTVHSVFVKNWFISIRGV